MLLHRQWFIVLWFAGTIFISAFLLFQVQPIISKMILPWFGGSPAVWTTCMLFFQVMLLGGYAYAHLLCSLRPARQTLIHLALIVAGLVALPITPGDTWKPPDSTFPVARILLLLAVHVGLPYFLLASTGPLAQTWFSRAFPGRSPYRLYSLSNVGSLGALLTYPFLFEPAWSSDQQGVSWSVGFVVFAVLCGNLSLAVWLRSRKQRSEEARDGTRSVGKSTVIQKPTTRRVLLWIGLPAWASMTLLAITNHVCQDVAVIPFLWVAPLSLYLLTFIICFDREFWYFRRVFAWATALGIVILSAWIFGDAINAALERIGIERTIPGLSTDIRYEVVGYLAIMFLICMVCHGELVRRKPEPQLLTCFYLTVSAGGALGGFFVAIVCPFIFSDFHELKLTIVGGFAIALTVLIDEKRKRGTVRRMRLQIPAWCAMAGAWILVVAAQLQSLDLDTRASVRNFYGVLQVAESGSDDPETHVRRLRHGRISHGIQYLASEKRMTPTMYYSPESGVGYVMRFYPRNRSLRVGVVGLGAGTMAAYGKAGDAFRFYEINPAVIDLSHRFFTFLHGSAATVNIVLGDARLSMEGEPSQHFDVLVLDAFSGDAIPAHLLTREAFQVYLRHMRPEGVVAVHTSNRHLDLTPVVQGLADECGWHVVGISHGDTGGVADAGSSWMLVTNHSEFLSHPEVFKAADAPNKRSILWTDQYSNLFEILE